MTYPLSKKIGFFVATFGVNAYLVSEAVKANNRYNRYLNNLSEEDLEKLQARNWYLERKGRFFGSGVILGERADIDSYNALSDHERERILVQYRWDCMRRESGPR